MHCDGKIRASVPLVNLTVASRSARECIGDERNLNTSMISIIDAMLPLAAGGYLISTLKCKAGLSVFFLSRVYPVLEMPLMLR